MSEAGRGSDDGTPRAGRAPVTPRERTVRAAAELIRTKGVSGTGMREIVAAAHAPRGSIQHYVPGGKDQLVTEALLWMGGVASRRVDRVLAALDPPTPAALLAATIDLWRNEFLTTGFDGGCPLVGAAVDMAATNADVRAAVRRSFDAWISSMARALQRTGVRAARAEPLATVLISALEGAIVLARVERDVRPLDAVASELAPLLDAVVSADAR